MANTKHLNEKELILEQIERDLPDLKKMSKLANDYAPDPKRIISSNLIKARNANIAFKPKIVLAGCALIMMLFISIPYYLRNDRYAQNVEVVELQEDPFLTDVDALTENALPTVFLYIQGESDLDFEKESYVFPD